LECARQQQEIECDEQATLAAFALRSSWLQEAASQSLMRQLLPMAALTALPSTQWSMLRSHLRPRSIHVDLNGLLLAANMSAPLITPAA
jgi:hypothetical protein